jgi:chaperonin GroEL (HSP60 family)
MLRTSLGPTGMDKIVIGKDGIVWVTNDGSTILSKLEVEHPAAVMLVELARAVDREVGDGTVSTVILVGSLLKSGESLLNKKIHPAVIIEGYSKAAEKALDLMQKKAIPVYRHDREMMKWAAITAMSGRFVSEDNEHLANLVVEAALNVAERTGARTELDLDRINLKKRIGESVADTKLVHGFAFFNERAHSGMPERIQGAKILVMKDELRFKALKMGLASRGLTQHYEHRISITTTDQMKAYNDEIHRIYLDMAERIVGLGANVVIVEKGVDPRLLDYLARFGILGIRKVVIEDLERIALSVGARIVTGIDEASRENLGEAELVEERKLAGQPWIFIEGCREPKSLTILIRGGQNHVLDETERSLNDAIHAVRNVLRKPMVVVGGGALEAELAFALRHWAQRFPNREQIAAMGFAEALESIPMTLAENSGLDPIDAMITLRSRLSKGETHVGIDPMNKKVANMSKMKVFEPLLVKEQMIKSASEMAILILRISDYFVARRLPKPEYDKKRQEELTRPERVKKIHREYGVESPYL